MDARRRDKIKAEMKKAEEYLSAAEALQRSGLFTPSATTSCYAAFHAATAAFLTIGFHNPQKERFISFMSAIGKFSEKIDPHLEKLGRARDEWGMNTGIEYSDNESLFRLYQTREFILEVKDFLRRTVKAG